MARDLAIDLGTANTLVYARNQGIVLNESTVIALNSRTQDVLAMGQDAWQMIGRTPGYIVAVRPLRGGAQLSAKVQLRVPNAVETLATDLLLATGDNEQLVVEAACFALGEVILHESLTLAVTRLSHLTLEHDDPLIREAAVAALGSIGDDDGLPAVLEACRDKPAIRRRAVLALAAFEGDDVDAALETALSDHDWQVRQAAEDLTGMTHESG